MTSGRAPADVQLLVAVVALPVPSAVNGRLTQGGPGSAAWGSVPSSSLSSLRTIKTTGNPLSERWLFRLLEFKIPVFLLETRDTRLDSAPCTHLVKVALISNLRSFSRNDRGGIRTDWLPWRPVRTLSREGLGGRGSGRGWALGPRSCHPGCPPTKAQRGLRGSGRGGPHAAETTLQVAQSRGSKVILFNNQVSLGARKG